MKIAFTVDDLSPLYSFEHLDLLHDTLGLKFDAFIPTNHFDKALLSNNLEWINELKKREWIQPNIHGVTHTNLMGGNSDYRYLDKMELSRSICSSICEFGNVGIEIYGIKAPGWDVNNIDEYVAVSKELGLKYVCLHPSQKSNIDMKIFGYTYCIHENFNLTTDSILHSHIHPSQGLNGLTNELTNYVISKLNPIQDQIESVFLKELL